MPAATSVKVTPPAGRAVVVAGTTVNVAAGAGSPVDAVRSPHVRFIEVLVQEHDDPPANPAPKTLYIIIRPPAE